MYVSLLPLATCAHTDKVQIELHLLMNRSSYARGSR